MTPFTGWQYLLIDAANQYGWDKALFEERIQWVEKNLDNLEAFADSAENKPLFMKAVQAIRGAQAGKPSGHLVGFDAVCSGIQIMSVITGCTAGAEATGLVDPNVRADAYSLTTNEMNKILGGKLEVSRPDAKKCLMTSFYGSKATPKGIFGEDTPELAAFYQAAMIVAPGAWELLQDLLASWKPYALEHSWKLPDGYDARVKVMEKVEARIEVDELDHATFTYEWHENVGSKKGLSNAANVVHSIDAYVLRCVHRRCNHDEAVLEIAYDLIEQEIHNRYLGNTYNASEDVKLSYYISQWERSKMADVVILPYLTQQNLWQVPEELLLKLLSIMDELNEFEPFPVVTIHDEFKCHPNNMNHLRQTYINVLADLADSEILSDILGQIHGHTGTWHKLSTDLSDKIRGSNYALS